MIRSKIIGTALVFVFFSLLATGLRAEGGGEDRLVYLHYENSGGEKGVTVFEYDESGQVRIALWHLLDGSRFSLNRHIYDRAGNYVRKERVFSDSLTSVEQFEYDEQGRLAFERFERSDSVGGTASYTYDANGYPETMVCEKYKGWLTALLEFETDDSGRRLRAHVMKDSAQVGTVAYEYDDHGNMIREHWDFPGRWTQTFRYEYDRCPINGVMENGSSNVYIVPGTGYRVATEEYDYSGKMGGPSHYTYDSSGKLVSKKFVRADGLSTETAFLYNRCGRLLRSHRTYSDGKWAMFTYDFTDEGQLATRHLHRSDGVIGKEQYDYDREGCLVWARLDNFDSWLTGEIVFGPSGAERPARGRFVADDGSSADIEFVYDTNRNLTRVHWEFSFGATQTYTFTYQEED